MSIENDDMLKITESRQGKMKQDMARQGQVRRHRDKKVFSGFGKKCISD